MGLLAGRYGGLQTVYDNIKLVAGEKYKIWMNRSAGLTDEEIRAAAKKEDVFTSFSRKWNSHFGGLLYITSCKMVSGGQEVLIEATAKSSMPTWGDLNMGWKWDYLNPLWKKVALLWVGYSVRGMNYLLIRDSKGKDIAAYEEGGGSQFDQPAGGGAGSGGSSSGSSGSIPTIIRDLLGTPEGSSPQPTQPKSSATPFVIGGVVLAAGIAAYFLLKKRNK